MKDKSMFGSHFKYVLILTLLAWMTYSLPSVKAAIQPVYEDGSSDQTANVLDFLLKKASTNVADQSQQYMLKKRVDMQTENTQDSTNYQQDQNGQKGNNSDSVKPIPPQEL